MTTPLICIVVVLSCFGSDARSTEEPHEACALTDFRNSLCGEQSLCWNIRVAVVSAVQAQIQRNPHDLNEAAPVATYIVTLHSSHHKSIVSMMYNGTSIEHPLNAVWIMLWTAAGIVATNRQSGSATRQL